MCYCKIYYKLVLYQFVQRISWDLFKPVNIHYIQKSMQRNDYNVQYILGSIKRNGRCDIYVLMAEQHFLPIEYEMIDVSKC
jgi:hypothetical protein